MLFKILDFTSVEGHIQPGWADESSAHLSRCLFGDKKREIEKSLKLIKIKNKSHCKNIKLKKS